MIKIYSVLILISWMHIGYAGQANVEFSQPIQLQRYNDLNQQLRCLVCQNQTIADSNAPLAQDLRQQVATLINNGKTDSQIIDYLTQRYGQFILYKPRLSAQTLLLWFGPLLLLLLAFTSLILVIRRRKRIMPPPGASI